VKIRCEGRFGRRGRRRKGAEASAAEFGRNAAEACALDGRRRAGRVGGDIVDGEETGFQRISVADNAQGFPWTHSRSYSGSFLLTKAKGTGSDWPWCRKIMVQHGGQVEVAERGLEGRSL